MRKKTRAIFPVFQGTDFLALVFYDMRVVLTVVGGDRLGIPSCVASTTSVVSFTLISISLAWRRDIDILFHIHWRLWGLFLWGLWICRRIWGSRCSTRRAIHDRVAFVEELAVVQRYPTAFIHSHLVLSVTMCLYDPPRLCPSTVLDLDRVFNLKYLEWAATLVIKLFVSPVPLSHCQLP